MEDSENKKCNIRINTLKSHLEDNSCSIDYLIEMAKMFIKAEFEYIIMSEEEKEKLLKKFEIKIPYDADAKPEKTLIYDEDTDSEEVAIFVELNCYLKDLKFKE